MCVSCMAIMSLCELYMYVCKYLYVYTLYLDDRVNPCVYHAWLSCFCVSMSSVSVSVSVSVFVSVFVSLSVRVRAFVCVCVCVSVCVCEYVCQKTRGGMNCWLYSLGRLTSSDGAHQNEA